MVLKYHKLEPDKIDRVFPKRGQMDLTEYEAMLTGMQAGDGMEIELDGVSVRAMKRRVTAAAARVLDLTLRFEHDESNNRLLFLVRPPKVPSAGPASAVGGTLS